MAIGNHPAVFVSSTCYDLAQVRKDVASFIETLGMRAVMSDLTSFPIDPHVDAIVNCLERVKEDADIFVLVVGGRYGSETESGKSVTSLEYLEARAKGIPRYVFVDKRILAVLPVWQRSPSADFSAVVDSPKLFEFVNSLRDPKENWVFPFDSAQDIVDTLRDQLAHLFKDALDKRRMLADSAVPPYLHDLSGAALAIAVQKPIAWEYRLFSQVYSDEIARSSAARRDLRYGLAMGQGVRLDDVHRFFQWVQTKLGEIQSLVAAAGKIVNVALREAVGPSGQPGSVDDIVYVAQRLGQVYRRLLEWTAEFKQAQVPEEMNALLAINARVSQNAIAELEEFSRALQRELETTVSRYEKTKEPQTLEICLTLTCPDMTDLEAELRRVGERLGLP